VYRGRASGAQSCPGETTRTSSSPLRPSREQYPLSAMKSLASTRRRKTHSGEVLLRLFRGAERRRVANLPEWRRRGTPPMVIVS
jgi:hypothetical protein